MVKPQISRCLRIRRAASPEDFRVLRQATWAAPGIKGPCTPERQEPASWLAARVKCPEIRTLSLRISPTNHLIDHHMGTYHRALNPGTNKKLAGQTWSYLEEMARSAGSDSDLSCSMCLRARASTTIAALPARSTSASLRPANSMHRLALRDFGSPSPKGGSDPKRGIWK